MKKKKLLKRIEELEVLNTKLENKYKHLLYIDDRLTILMMRQLYENENNLEDLLLKAYTTDVTECKWSNDVKHGYMWENELIPRVKYCKECKLPMKQKVEMLEDRSGIRIKNHFNFHKL